MIEGKILACKSSDDPPINPCNFDDCTGHVRRAAARGASRPGNDCKVYRFAHRHYFCLSEIVLTFVLGALRLVHPAPVKRCAGFIAGVARDATVPSRLRAFLCGSRAG
jgi:hypothetical protein